MRKLKMLYGKKQNININLNMCKYSFRQPFKYSFLCSQFIYLKKIFDHYLLTDIRVRKLGRGTPLFFYYYYLL